MASLGQLTLNLVAKIGGFTGPLDKASRESIKHSKKISKNNSAIQKSFDKTLSSIKGYVAGYLTIAAASRAIAGTVKVGAQFEQQMKTVQGVMRATGDDYKKLSEAAKLMGATTEWSASQSAQALQYMGMAGYSVQTSIKALPGMLQLASAAGIDLGRASDIVTDSLTAMGMSVDELARFNDVLIGTITRSNTNVEMLGESLKYVAPIASQLGYSIEQLSAMLGILANAGIKASDAGTDLRKAMLENIDVSKKLGTNQNDLVGTLKAAKAAGWGVNEIVKNYGILASKSVLVLMDQIDAFEELENTLHNVAGETQALADKKLDTLIGDFKILKSSIEGLQLTIFNSIEDPLRSSVQQLTKLISLINKSNNDDEGRIVNLDKLKKDIELIKGGLEEAEKAGDNTFATIHGGGVILKHTIESARKDIKMLTGDLERLQKIQGISSPGAAPPSLPKPTGGGTTGNTEGDSWRQFGEILKKTSEFNRQKLEIIKKSNDTIKKYDEQLLQDAINNDNKLRQLTEQADIAELNNIENSFERELALNEYKFERLKELYADGSEELLQIERLQAAERMKIVEESNKGYWQSYLESMENNMTNMDEIVGDTLNNLSSRFGDLFATAIFDSKNLEDSLKNIAKAIGVSIVSAIGKMAAQWVLYKAVKKSVDKSAQSAAAPMLAANAEIAALQSGINAFASTAAIPLVGPELAPAAMAAALSTTQPIAAAIATLSLAGMAHDGIDMVPHTGTWLLEKGERVVTSGTSKRLDDTLKRIEYGNGGSYNTASIPNMRMSENHYHYHNDGVSFLNRSSMRDAARMLMVETEREKTRRGAVS